MIKTEAGTPRGILRLNVAGGDRVQYSRRLPAENLRALIEHYWVVDWDLPPDVVERAETLPHPCVHVVFEQGRSMVVGVVRGRFTRVLKGSGRVFGIKFRPGAFYLFTRTPVAQFTDRTVEVTRIFGPDAAALEQKLLSSDDEQCRVDAADRFLRERLPERDETVALIGSIVPRVIADRGLKRVEDLVCAFGIERRQLQRIFHRYVGITPKWTIQRYRLHEAVEQMGKSRAPDWARLAADLGYFDQSHFINDFRTVVGCTPGEYLQASP